MKVFLTGHKGYVGNVLARMLLEEGFEVIGCDVEYYPQEFVEKESLKIKSLKKDIRQVSVQDLKGCDAVIHLAALSNDPLGEINPMLTHDINYLATIHLAKLAKKVGIERFIFSSSCSAYGANSEIVNEDSLLTPLTAYSKSKVDSEVELLKLLDENFCPVNLRNATVYGVSPCMRLDIVVNNLTCSAYTTKHVKLLSDGTAWRPLIHVEDMSSAFIAVLNSDKENVKGETFNVGSNEQNHTVKEIAEIITDIIPDSKIEYSRDAGRDSRTYRVNFDKIKKKLNYKTKWKVKDGVNEIYQVLRERNFTEEDFKNKDFYRVSYLKWLIERKSVDKNLFPMTK